MNNFLFRKRYGVKIYNNILTESERIQLLTISKNFLTIIEGCPGLQTNSNFHLVLEQMGLGNILSKIQKKSKSNGTIHKCWVNYTDNEFSYTNWHTHSTSKKISVYFIENPENIGTICRVKEKEFHIKTKTNSLIILPTTIEHTVPYNVKKPRYSLAIDLI
jgi:hypothetical protein